MEIYEIILVIVLPILAISTIVLLRTIKQKKNPKIEETAILQLFDKSNVLDVSYIRNKIVVSFTDVTLFQHNELKQFGATGISIIGDKVKFYFIDNSITTTIFEKIQMHIK